MISCLSLICLLDTIILIYILQCTNISDFHSQGNYVFYFFTIWFIFVLIYFYKNTYQFGKILERGLLTLFHTLMMGFVLQIIIRFVYKRQILLKIHLLRQDSLLTRKIKCSWAPVQSLDWLGFRWNIVRGTLELQKSKLDLFTLI